MAELKQLEMKIGVGAAQQPTKEGAPSQGEKGGSWEAEEVAWGGEMEKVAKSGEVEGVETLSEEATQSQEPQEWRQVEVLQEELERRRLEEQKRWRPEEQERWRPAEQERWRLQEERWRLQEEEVRRWTEEPADPRRSGHGVRSRRSGRGGEGDWGLLAATRGGVEAYGRQVVRRVDVRLSWDTELVGLSPSFKEASKGTKFQQGEKWMEVRTDEPLTWVEEEVRMMLQCSKSYNHPHLHLKDGQGRDMDFIGDYTLEELQCTGEEVTVVCTARHRLYANSHNITEVKVKDGANAGAWKVHDMKQALEVMSSKVANNEEIYYSDEEEDDDTQGVVEGGMQEHRRRVEELRLESEAILARKEVLMTTARCLREQLRVVKEGRDEAANKVNCMRKEQVKVGERSGREQDKVEEIGGREPGWRCHLCTFHNLSISAKCVMCGAD